MQRELVEHHTNATVMIRSVLGVFVALALVGAAARASGQDSPGSYLELKGGIYSPSANFNLKNINLQTSFDTDTKTGVNGEIAIGHYFLPTVALELGAGFFKGKGTVASAPRRSVDFNVIPVVLTVKALIPMGAVHPYGEVGLGAYFTRFDVTDNGGSFRGASTLGLHAGAGIDVNVSPMVFLGLEGRYVSANPSFGDQKIKLNDTEYAVNGFKLNGFTTTAALGYRF
jgi:outer membrane protein W